MSAPRIRLPREVERLLEGVEYEVRNGGKHAQLWIRGKMVQVLPRGNWGDQGHQTRNMVARVKRFLRGQT